jgi:hypothetical protein
LGFAILADPENRDKYLRRTFVYCPSHPDNVKLPSDGKERKVPLITIADLLNKSYESTVELLVAARLLFWQSPVSEEVAFN